MLQAAGGGVAAAAKKTNQSLLSAGNNIMMAGIAFQVATMAVCGVLGVDFAYRVFRKTTGLQLDEKLAGSNRGFLFFCAGEAFAYLTVLIRCIYR